MKVLQNGTTLDAAIKWQVEGPRDAAGAEIRVLISYIVQFKGIQAHVAGD